MPERYQVPKNEASGRAVLADGTTADLKLYLSDRAEHHAGRERPSDLLNGEEPFVPVDLSGTGFVLLHRAAVLLLTVRLADEQVEDLADGAELLQEEDASLPDGAERVDVRVALEEGTTVDGTMTYLMPPGERRLQDFLNQSPRFVPLRQDDRIHLVNTERVVRVDPK